MTVRAAAEFIGGSVEGDGERIISGIAPIDTAGGDDITFAADAKFAARLSNCKAAAAIIGQDVAAAPMPLIRVKSVQPALAKLLVQFAPPEDLPPRGVHPSAVIAGDAQIADGAAIGPNVVISSRAKIASGCILCAGVFVGADVRIGDNTILFEGVVIRHDCQIGNRVRIGPNSVIGYDGFGFYFSDGAHHRVPHVGEVVIEDDVELDACTCVDRAKFGQTRVGAGTKVDNLVQIAHNVHVGKGCLMAAQAGIAGSTELGNFVVLGGHAGIRDNIKLGDGVQCTALAGVGQDVPAGQVVMGIPARPITETLRIFHASAKLPDLLKKIKELESRLQAIESPKDNK